MKFPIITHIDQIRKAIEGRPEFTLHDRDGYSVANYNVSYEDTFPPLSDTDDTPALLRECRGLLFAPTGEVISRPFHKFFNVNQIPETMASAVDLSRPHVVLDKMDGSMVRTAIIQDSIRLCTKAGITDESLMAEEFVENYKGRANYTDFFKLCEYAGFTAIFEFCSRRNQIILDYPEPSLVLTAIRQRVTGKYAYYYEMIEAAKGFHVPVVDKVEQINVTGYEAPTNCVTQVIDHIRAQRDIEGVVIRFDDGEMIKMKTEWYCIKHAAKDSLLMEKNLLKIYLEEKIDDILPLLDDQFRARVDEYLLKVKTGIADTHTKINNLLEDCYREAGHERAAQAKWVSTKVEQLERPLLFNALDGKDVRERINEMILKNTSSGPKLDSVRPLFKAEWV
jgi:RNA ligase